MAVSRKVTSATRDLSKVDLNALTYTKVGQFEIAFNEESNQFVVSKVLVGVRIPLVFLKKTEVIQVLPLLESDQIEYGYTLYSETTHRWGISSGLMELEDQGVVSYWAYTSDGKNPLQPCIGRKDTNLLQGAKMVPISKEAFDGLKAIEKKTTLVALEIPKLA